MKNPINIIMLTVVIFSCANKQNQSNIQNAYSYKAPLNDRKLINKLLDEAINDGNTKAYNEVASYYLLENMGQEFLYYSLIMANKHNDPEAYYHVYIILSKPRNGKTLDQMDNKTKNFALYYLLKSYEMGFGSSKYQVEEVFGADNPPKSSYYLNRFSKE